jgi:DNA-binding transcriptional MocR family regulator
VSVSSVSGTAQALVLTALDDPALGAQREALHADLAARWARLRDGLEAAGVPAWPFNAAFFALLPAPTDAEELRHAFLKDGLGLVSAAAGPNLRLSYASLQLDDIDPVVEILAKRLAR